MTGFVKNTVSERLEGDRPSMIRAVAVAGMVGIGAGILTYKLMRTQG